MRTTIVVAAAENDVIGAAGGLPWHLPEDLRHFKRLTLGHTVIMGRRTHESIIARLGHPLPGRVSIVVSSTPGPGTDSPHWATSVRAAFDLAASLGDEEVFVIGGGALYAATLDLVDRVVLTRVHQPYPGDVSMPADWLAGFTEIARDDSHGETFSIITYRRGGA